MDEDVTSTSSSGFTSDGGAHGHLVRWPEDSAVTSTFIDGPRFVEETVLGKIRGSEISIPIPATGNHDPRYRVLRTRFECRVRTAKSPARGPECTDPHQEACPAIASAGPCMMIFGRRCEKGRPGKNGGYTGSSSLASWFRYERTNPARSWAAVRPALVCIVSGRRRSLA